MAGGAVFALLIAGLLMQAPLRQGRALGAADHQSEAVACASGPAGQGRLGH